MSFLSGFIGIIGPPNVGKSTLLNRILGAKLAVVSPKPQTTRNRITGIYHGGDFQMVFTDTPGIHKTRTALHKSMVESALAASQEVDIVLFVTAMDQPDDPEISSIFSRIRHVKKPCILAVNKIDLGPKEQLLPIMEKSHKRYPFEVIIPVSARTGDGIDILLEELKSRLKPGPPFYPAEIKTDQSEAFLVSEIIREKIYYLAQKELPYSSAVTVERMKEDRKRRMLSIAARIHVEHDSQKGIIIGEGGRMIRRIGRAARLELQEIFAERVYLDLMVRVEKDWTKNTHALRRLGY